MSSSYVGPAVAAMKLQAMKLTWKQIGVLILAPGQGLAQPSAYRGPLSSLAECNQSHGLKSSGPAALSLQALASTELGHLVESWDRW